MLVTQLAPHGYDLGEVFNCVVAPYNACRHNRDVFCDQSRVETIILGQDTAGASELTKLVRVDASHRQSGREQGTDDAALVTTARPIAETASGPNLAINSAQPGVSLHTEKHTPSGNTKTSKRSFDTSMPPTESSAIFVSHPC
jgi:hypothetical protein